MFLLLIFVTDVSPEYFLQLLPSSTRALSQRLSAMALGSLRLKLGLLVAVVREPNRRNLELISARARARARACGPPAAHFCAVRLVAARVGLCRLSHDSCLLATGVGQR